MTQQQETPPAQELDRAIDDAARALRVQTRQLERLEPGKPGGEPLGLEGLRGVPLTVTIELGRTRLPLHDLLSLSAGSLVTLDRGAHEPADIYVGGRLYARGEVVTVDDRFGVRVTAIVGS